MIIAGHIIGHSGAVDQAEGIMGVLVRCAYIMILPAVNVYVLISGYFLVDAKWNVKRIALLWLQVFFYSVLCYMVMLATGYADFTPSGALKVVLPVSGNQYWFARVFWVFSLFAPFEAILLRGLTKKQYQCLLAVIVVIFSLWRSFLPFATTVNNEDGNSIMWFGILFTFAAYLKLHGDPAHGCKCYAVMYIVSASLTIVSYFFLSYVLDRLGLGGKGTSLFTEYTSITMIGMFMVFVKLKERAVSPIIRRTIMFFSSSTYSVYLIHENKYVEQWLWKAIRPGEWIGSSAFFVYMTLAVVVILIICSLIDKTLWLPAKYVMGLLPYDKLQNKINKMLYDQHSEEMRT